MEGSLSPLRRILSLLEPFEFASQCLVVHCLEPAVQLGHHFALGVLVLLRDLLQLDVLVALLEAPKLGLVKHLVAVQLLLRQAENLPVVTVAQINLTSNFNTPFE